MDVYWGIIYNVNIRNTLLFKTLGLVRFLKEVSYAHQCCIYLIKNTVRIVIL